MDLPDPLTSNALLNFDISDFSSDLFATQEGSFDG